MFKWNTPRKERYFTRCQFYGEMTSESVRWAVMGQALRGRRNTQICNTMGIQVTSLHKGEGFKSISNIFNTKSVSRTTRLYASESQEPSLLEKVWTEIPLLRAFRWRHHIHLIVVRSFYKIGKMGVGLWKLYLLGNMVRASNWHCTMVRYLG